MAADMDDCRLPTRETKQALFWAVSAAQHEGEAIVSRNRLLSAILRAESVAEYCERAQIAVAELANEIDPSFDECMRRIRQELADNGWEIGSKQHIASVQPRPFEPATQAVLRALWEPTSERRIAPLEILLEMLRADPALAAILARHGMHADSISAALGE